MATNSLYLGVYAAPADDDEGITVRVCPTAQPDNPVAVIRDFLEVSFHHAISEAGEGSVTLSLESPLFAGPLEDGSDPRQTLLGYEMLWQVYEGDARRAEWLGTALSEGLLEDGETRTVTVSGNGTAQALTWAKVFSPHYPAWNMEQWPTLGMTQMAVWLGQLAEANKRGTVTFVEPSFTGEVDSAGQPWEDINYVDPLLQQKLDIGTAVGLQLDLGTDLLELLGRCSGQRDDEPSHVRVEWTMWPGYVLDVRRQVGAHREQDVIFYEGSAVISVTRDRARDQIANLVVVREAHGFLSTAADPTSAAHWGQREHYEVNESLEDHTRRAAVAATMLAQRKDETDSWTIEVSPDEPGRRVFVDYRLGDWIGFSRQRDDGAAATVEPMRVMGLAMQYAAGQRPKLQLTLRSLYEQREVDLARQLTYLLNLVNNSGPDLGDVGDGDGLLTRDPDGNWGFTAPDEMGGTPVVFGPTPPSNPAPGTIWIDTSHAGT